MAIENEVDRIRNLLMRHPGGLTIEEVSKELEINRSTASKYLNSLVFSGAVSIRKLGPAKLFSLKEHLPVHSLINITSDLILILDSDMKIHDINEPMLSLFGLKQDAVKSVSLESTPLQSFIDQEILESIRGIRGGKSVSLEKEVNTGGKARNFHMRIIPLMFESGNSGYGIVMKEVPPAYLPDDTVPPSLAGLDLDTFRKACSQAFQLNLLFRRFTLNQIALIEDSVRALQKVREDTKSREIVRNQESVLQNLKFHLVLLEEYLGDELAVPYWHSLEDIIIRTVPFQNLGHVRFFSDVKSIEINTDATCARIFYSLVENSLVHGVRVTSVRITAKEHSQDLVIVYEDDGVGVPPSEKNAIFEWGHGKHKGHSLFLSRQILAITDISIHETGVPGKGARFEIKVPQGCWRKGGKR